MGRGKAEVVVEGEVELMQVQVHGGGAGGGLVYMHIGLEEG